MIAPERARRDAAVLSMVWSWLPPGLPLAALPCARGPGGDVRDHLVRNGPRAVQVRDLALRRAGAEQVAHAGVGREHRGPALEPLLPQIAVLGGHQPVVFA